MASIMLKKILTTLLTCYAKALKVKDRKSCPTAPSTWGMCVWSVWHFTRHPVGLHWDVTLRLTVAWERYALVTSYQPANLLVTIDEISSARLRHYESISVLEVSSIRRWTLCLNRMHAITGCTTGSQTRV